MISPMVIANGDVKRLHPRQIICHGLCPSPYIITYIVRAPALSLNFTDLGPQEPRDEYLCGSVPRYRS